jgi:general secretion pathway protein M
VSEPAAALRLRRFGSLAILGGLALIVLAPVIFGVLFLAQFSSDAAQAETQRLARYEAEIAARPQLEKELLALRAQEAAVPSVLKGENAAVAGARLQSQLRTLVSESGGAVRSTQDMPPRKRGGLEQINVVCEFTLPMSRLKDVLHRLDTAEPYLFVDAVTIDAREQAGDDFDVELSIRLTVHAFRVMGAA